MLFLPKNTVLHIALELKPRSLQEQEVTTDERFVTWKQLPGLEVIAFIDTLYHMHT